MSALADPATRQRQGRASRAGQAQDSWRTAQTKPQPGTGGIPAAEHPAGNRTFVPPNGPVGLALFVSALADPVTRQGVAKRGEDLTKDAGHAGSAQAT